MTMNHRESIAEYGTHFQNVCREGGLKDDEGLALRFLGSLDEHIQENVKIAWNARNGQQLPSSVEEVLQVADAVTLKRKFRYSKEGASPSQRRKNNGEQGN